MQIHFWILLIKIKNVNLDFIENIVVHLIMGLLTVLLKI